MVRNEKGGDPSPSPPPLPVRPTSPSASPLPLGFASASSSSLNVTSPGASGPRLSAQHERLILELLPFKDASQFREWLAFLDGDWDEYCRDYLDPQYRVALYDEAGNAVEALDKTPSDPEPDKVTTAQRAKDAINNQSVIFLSYHPDKTTWTAEDHAVRFVATAIADSLLRKVWGERDWRKRPVEIARAVYEVLSYKRAGYVEYQQQLWLLRQKAQAQAQAQQQQLAAQRHAQAEQQQLAALQHAHQQAARVQRQQQQQQQQQHRQVDEMLDNPPEYDP